MNTNENQNYSQNSTFNQALSMFDNQVHTDNDKITLILKKSVPRELVLHFNGNLIQKSFAHFFSTSTSNIYTSFEPQQNPFFRKLPYVAFSLMFIAMVLCGLAVATFFVDSPITNAFVLK